MTKIAAGSAASVCTVARVTGTISRDEEKTCERHIVTVQLVFRKNTKSLFGHRVSLLEAHG